MVRRLDHPAALSAAAALVLLGAACATLPKVRPAAVLVDLQGEERLLSLFEADVQLVLHFWATWCAACGAELHALQRAVAGCRSTGPRVVAVNVTEPSDVVRRYVTDQRLALEVLRDPEGLLWRSGRFGGLPANWIFTKGGDSASTGPQSEAKWRVQLHDLGCEADQEAPPHSPR